MSSSPTGSPAAPEPGARQVSRRERLRVAVVVIAVALLIVFAVLNSQTVKINWLVTTTHTPLIVAIFIGALLGWVGGALLARARRRRSKR